MNGARPDRAFRRASAASEQQEAGLLARRRVRRSQLGSWLAPSDRRDPVQVLQAQDVDRVPELVPLRYERMSANPFSFYRGAAALMAADLATRANTGLFAQLAGDAHLANFGGFATAERAMVFDLNDFDETLRGPFEWDVQRLAASFEVAGRYRDFTPEQRSALVTEVARSYRDAMAEFSRSSRLDVWYARMEAEDLVARRADELDEARVEAFRRRIAKGRSKTSAKAVSRYTRVLDDGRLALISQPPFVVPLRQLLDESQVDVQGIIDSVLDSYRSTLPDDRRMLLSGYEAMDAARKVVGVGSVGTRCWIVLLTAREDPSDDLVLQLKQAGPSVLESVLEASPYDNHGRRVVEGQRLMQASGDMLLGWTLITSTDGVTRHFYVRQMWDWKTSADLDTMEPEAMKVYAHACGWSLARAHARSSSRLSITAYLGSGKSFEKAMCAFAESYADQNQRDYEALLAAIDTGRVERSHLES